MNIAAMVISDRFPFALTCCTIVQIYIRYVLGQVWFGALSERQAFSGDRFCVKVSNVFAGPGVLRTGGSQLHMQLVG